MRDTSDVLDTTPEDDSQDERAILHGLGLHLTQERRGATIHGLALDDPFMVWEPESLFKGW